MSRLEIPVQAKTLRATGDVKLWVDLEVRLKDSAGGLAGSAPLGAEAMAG